MSVFSIIVPIYNVEKYIDSCVQSILKQTYGNYELILVDDGSPDRCPEICDKYSVEDARIKVIHKENGGVTSARRAGLEMARGDYIVYVDGDDWLSCEYLESFFEVISKYDPDIVCCNHYIAGQNTVKCGMNFDTGYYDRGDIIKKIFPYLMQKSNATYFMPSFWAKAFKRNLAESYHNNVSPQIKVGEDGACVIPTVYNSSSMYIMDEAMYFYRVNDTSVTKEKKAFSWDGPEMIHQHLKNYIDVSQFDFEEQLYRKTTHEIFTVVVSQFYRKESYRAIVKDIKNNISRDVYAEAIKKCRFKGSVKAKFMALSLKYRILFPVFLYSKIK